MVAASVGRDVVQGVEPVLSAPHGGVGGVDGDDRQAPVRSHLDQPISEAGRRDTRDQAPEGSATPAPRRAAPGVLAALVACLGEVEVFDHDRGGSARLGQGDQLGDRGAQMPVPGRRRQPGQVEGDRHRGTHRVARGVDDGCCQVSGVEVDGDHRGGSQLGQGERRRLRGRLPRGVEIPAILAGVVCDVVAERPRGCLGGHLGTPVGETHQDTEPVAAVGTVGQMSQRGGQLDLDPSLTCVPADRLVAPGLVGFAVGGDEPPSALPASLPRRLVQSSLLQVGADPGERCPTPADRHPPLAQSSLHLDEASGEALETALLVEALGGAHIPASAAGPAAHGGGQSPAYAPGPDPQSAGLGNQVALGQAPGVLGAAGDRPSPP